MEQKLTTEEQLLHLRCLTHRLGVLHEAQLLQVRNYPLVLPIQKATTHIDVKSKYIKYECESEGVIRKTKKNTKICETIHSWLQFLLWDDVILEILINGRGFYDSRLNKNAAS